ncbi:MAG: tetratricopeptide repeat protein [Dissulfurimicrobium sp.]|uniref:tetratricopeptide repeat protein n=1 Tax=Dissulfurimicrobium TaxID=1769732 RepID=UPI001EDA6925|nr:tetratricopeptide repeat protein [Dissulfurimicrobium hydrothermale]UKL13436.1 tetratricopeptide repeat protein [Dissulfurimicrobium hydrothermale]
MKKELEDLFIEGQFKLMDGDLNGSIKIFCEIIEKDPEAGQAYQARAVAYMKLDNIDAAVSDINSAISCEPQNVRYIYRKGIILFKKGDIQEALDSVNHALEIDPTYPAAYVLRSKIYEKLGDNEQAAADMSHAMMLKKETTKMVDW